MSLRSFTPVQRDFVVVRVSKLRWRIAVVKMKDGELLGIDFVSGKHKDRDSAEEACQNWNAGLYGEY